MKKQQTTVKAKPRIRKHGKHWICGIEYPVLGIEGCMAETPQEAYAAWAREMSRQNVVLCKTKVARNGLGHA